MFGILSKFAGSMIRSVSPADYQHVCEIYNYYVSNTTITFDVEELSVSDVETKLAYNSRFPCLVCEEEGQVVGFVAASEWKAKAAYQKTVELSIYLQPAFVNLGFGTLLYNSLIGLLKQLDIHSIISGIIMPNPSSVAFHEKVGFKKVGHFTQSGFKHEAWHDVGYWQLML